MIDDVRFRRPVEDDYRYLVDRVDDWWGGRTTHPLFRRFWFQHFTGSSWVAEVADGALVGFLVGFLSPDHPDEAYVHLVATSPNHRHRGIARRLYEQFIDDVRARGVGRVTAVTWPGNRASVAFHRAIGFQPDEGPGTQRLYGTPAYPNHDAYGEDRVVFSRTI